jgi:hypothetical protein
LMVWLKRLGSLGDLRDATHPFEPQQ